MEKIQLGNSPLHVSSLCFGTMYFGTKVDRSQSFSLLDQFLEAGGNFIDTANNYAFWMENSVGDESENTLGAWLKERKNRDKVILATKVGARPRHPGGGLDDSEGLLYDTIIREVENSLKRLQTDYIDLYYAHVDWYEYPLEERLKAFDLLVNQGKVREIGASNIYPWRLERSQQMAKVRGWKTYCCVQQKYSYLRPKYNADFHVQKLIDQECLDYAVNNPEITFIAYSPLLLGVYTRSDVEMLPEFNTTDSQMRLTMLTRVADEVDATKNQVVLAWMLQNTPKVIPLIAASKVDQLQENLGALRVNLTAQLLEQLNHAGD